MCQLADAKHWKQTVFRLFQLAHHLKTNHPRAQCQLYLSLNSEQTLLVSWNGGNNKWLVFSTTRTATLVCAASNKLAANLGIVFVASKSNSTSMSSLNHEQHKESCCLFSVCLCDKHTYLTLLQKDSHFLESDLSLSLLHRILMLLLMSRRRGTNQSFGRYEKSGAVTEKSPRRYQEEGACTKHA